ncbi:MAG: hypothetical protein ACXQS8_07535, partial [Candidatus Helarchaeales archaeon]
DRSRDGGACTLASFGTPKVISGFVMDAFIDLISGKKLQFNHVKYDHVLKNVTRDKFEKARGCIFCGPSGIVQRFSRGDLTGLIEWLYEK